MIRSLLSVALALIAANMALAKPGASFVETHEPPREVRFVVLGDTQFANMDVFERMAHEINMLRPHFVIQVGDLINGYTHNYDTARAEWVTFRNQIAPMTMPFYPVPGNHDIVTPETLEVYAEEWGEDRFTYSFSWGNVHCISLNSFWRDESGVEHDRIATWQQEWLADNLAAYSELHGGEIDDHAIFVFLHSPLWRYAPDHPGRGDWEIVHRILQDYPVRLVIGGHTHEHVWEQQDDLHYLVINSSGGIPQNNERGGFMHTYMHVSVMGDDVRFAAIKAGSILPLDTVDSSDRRTYTRYHIPSEMLIVDDWRVGEPLDVEVTVPVHNRVNDTRRFRLDWRIPFGAEIAAEPHSQWVELQAGESRDMTFRLTSASAPALNLRPTLEVSATDTIRTGVVDRETEARLREQRAAAQNDPSIHRSNIRLDEPVTFRAQHTLFLPPVATATRLATAINLDGRLDDEAWQAATPITDFTNSSQRAGTHNEVRFLYDDDYLYVGAWMGEPNPEGLKAGADPESPYPFTWDDDDFGLSFDPQLTRSDYTRLFINSIGTRFNSRPRHLPEDIRYWRSEYDSAIHVGEDHWSIEMRIPWHETYADEAPQPGDKFGLMIVRRRQQQSPAEMMWRGPTGTGLYDPRRYGVLVFE